MHSEIWEKPLLSRPAWQRWGPLGLMTTKNAGWLVSFPTWWDKARSVSAVLKGAGTFHPPTLTPGHLFHVSCWGEGDRAVWGDDWVRGFFLQLKQALMENSIWTCHPTWQPLTTCGYQALDMWLFQTEMCWECKTWTGFKDLLWKKKVKYLNCFYMDYTLT